jgi:hypothetical protein
MSSPPAVGRKTSSDHERPFGSPRFLIREIYGEGSVGFAFATQVLE